MVSSTVATAAFLSTGIISLVPNVILFLFPRYAQGEGGQSKFLTLGQAMSAGCLLGDVFLHTLSHVSPGAGIWVLVGVTIFLAADLLIRTLDPHSHSHSACTTTTTTGSNRSSHHHGTNDGALQNGNRTEKSPSCSPVVVHRSTVILNLAADALHNFTDGLAIGASYALHDVASNQVEESSFLSLAALLTSRGGLASISVLFHEVPHELGDFCTLVKAGYSKSQAVMAQFFTALAAFLGTAVALSLSAGWEGEVLLLITAGGFVYLAATTILPEVLEAGDSVSFRFWQLLFFVLGILFLHIVSLLEEYDEHGHGHHHGHGSHHEL